MNRKERKEMKRQKKRETWAGRHPVANLALEQGRRNVRAKQLTAVTVVIILLVFGGLVLSVVYHDIYAAKNGTHPGVYFFVESGRFVNSNNSSGLWSYVTAVKNTGSLFIDTVTITNPSTGSTIGVIPSIPAGNVSSATFLISGVTNDTAYVLEYNAVSGNKSYDINYPVIS